MSYLNILRKINNYNNSTEAVLQNGKDYENRVFIDDASYRKAKIQKNNLSEENIDIRIKNVSVTTEEKKLILRPDTIVDVGSYISFDGRIYLVLEYENNSTSPTVKVERCKSSLKWKDEVGYIHGYPCLLSKDSYGSKSLANNEILTFGDSKGKIFVQDNEFTRKIKTNWRFIMNGSETDIYKVIDISRATTTGLIEIVAQKDIEKAEDDIENSIAFNNFNELSNESKYIIQGLENVKVGKTESYIITPHLDVDWRVDNNNIAEITSTKNGMCTILGKIKDEIVTLSAYLKESKIAEINISVDR